MTREITVAVYQRFKIILTIGIYASNDGNPETINIRNYLESLVEKNPEILQLPGFYINNSKVSFDLIIDFKAEREKIRQEILEKMKSQFPDYYFSCILDDDLSD